MPMTTCKRSQPNIASVTQTTGSFQITPALFFSRLNTMPETTATPTSSIDASMVRLLAICSHSRLGSRSFRKGCRLRFQAVGLFQVHQPRRKADEHRYCGQEDGSRVNHDPDPESRLTGVGSANRAATIRPNTSGRRKMPKCVAGW